MGDFIPTYSTDNIWREDDMTQCLSNDLNAIEENITTLQTGKANTTHTHAEYAAAGYGLGEATSRVITFEEIDNIKVNGLYRFTTTASLNGVAINHCRMRVENYDHNWVRQTLITHNGNTELIRDCTDGVWGSWECPNPPMKLGVEYRTTSRWCEKPVYTQLINIGDLPNQTTKTVNWSTPTGTVTNVLSCIGTVAGSGDTMPYRGSGNGEIAVSATPTYITIAITGYNMAGYDGIVELRYVK